LKLVLCGDGAEWITTGSEYIPQVQVRFLDEYHLNQKFFRKLGRSEFVPKLLDNIEENIETAGMAAELGYQTVVLQSGEDEYPAAEIAEIIKEIKNTTDMAVTLSLGERDFAAYKLWWEAGADRYLLKHEIADQALYEKYHPGMSYQNLRSLSRKINYYTTADLIADCF